MAGFVFFTAAYFGSEVGEGWISSPSTKSLCTCGALPVSEVSSVGDVLLEDGLVLRGSGLGDPLIELT